MFKILFGKDLQKEIKRKKTPANPLGLIPFPGPAPLFPPFSFLPLARGPTGPAPCAQTSLLLLLFSLTIGPHVAAPFPPFLSSPLR